MSRWIDADVVKEALKQNTPQYMWGEVLTTVNVQPYIDIVRCGECRYYRDYDGCFFSTEFVDADGFCSYGERREDE